MRFYKNPKEKQSPASKGMRVLFAGASAMAAAPLCAQVVDEADDPISAELEALVDAAQSPESAIVAAREQIAGDDLSGAASTLERALLTNRNANDVRALYASVLCRLDDPKGAEVEIGLLKGGEISPDLAAELRANCGLTPTALSDSGSGQRDSAIWGSFSVGLSYDTDTVGATNLQFISPFFAGRFQNDALSVNGHIDINARLPTGGGWGYAGFSADAKWEALGSNTGNGNNDYQGGEIRFGYGSRSENAEFEIGPVARHSRIFNTPYLTEYGGQARVSLLGENNSELIIATEVVYEDFSFFGTGNANLLFPPANFASLRDGWNFDFTLASVKREEDGGYVYFGAGAEYKDAGLRAYWAGRIFALAQKPIDAKGSYVQASGLYRYVDFEARLLPLTPTAAPRSDHRLYFRTALGTPLNDENLYGEIGASFSARLSSNSANLYDYDSVGVDARLIWRF